MSRPTRNAANTTITIWYKRTTGIGYDDTVTYDPVVAQACYEQGGSTTFTDSSGVNFTPKSQYWLEVLAENPRPGDYVALGDQSAIEKPSDAVKAESIRVAALQDCSLLNDVDDIHLVT